jgi:thymidylate kinase
MQFSLLPAPGMSFIVDEPARFSDHGPMPELTLFLRLTTESALHRRHSVLARNHENSNILPEFKNIFGDSAQCLQLLYI